MKIIQSWIPYQKPNSFTIEKNEAYMIMLSSLLLQKNYGEVTLFTNEYQKNWFEKIGFPYQYNIDALKNEQCDLFGMPKFKSIQSLNEPFIHYDLDTLVFTKPHTNRKTPYIFSHPDIEFMYEKMSVSSPEDIMLSEHFESIYKTYIGFYLQNKSIFTYDKTFPHDEIQLKEIPNMNIICVNEDLDLFKNAIDDTLKIYEKLKEKFSNDYISSIFLEQFVFPLYLKKNNKNYKCDIEDYFNELLHLKDSPFVFSTIPVTIKNENLDKWPLKFETFQYCSMCKYEHNEIKEWYDKKSLSDLNYDFLTYYHIGGGCKSYPLVNAMIIGHTIKHFGEEYVIQVHNFYKELLGNKQYISLGEKLYEELTGSTIFTDLNKKSIF